MQMIFYFLYISVIATQISEIATQISEIATQITVIATQITVIATQITEIATQITVIATHISVLATQISEIATQISEIATQISDCYTNHSDHYTNFSDCYTIHSTDRITHTTVFVTPVVRHWLEREIAQWVHHEGSIRRPIAPWANALTTELHLAPSSMGPPWRIDPKTHRTMSERSYHRATLESHLDNIVKAQPSTAMSCVAARKFNMKKMHVSNKILTSAVLSESPRTSVTWPDSVNMNTPIRYCVGTSHVFRRPKHEL